MIKTNTNAIVSEKMLHDEVPFKLEVSNITQLTKAQLDQLKAGDVVVKITGNQKHSYRVSYKGEGAGQGICLTYSDASIVETVSYDRSGSNWVYNSTDVSSLGSELPSLTGNAEKFLKVKSDASGVEWDNIPEELPTIASGDAGKVVKVNEGETGYELGEVSGGMKLYKTSFNIQSSYPFPLGITIITDQVIQSITVERLKEIFNYFADGSFVTYDENTVSKGLYILCQASAYVSSNSYKNRIKNQFNPNKSFTLEEVRTQGQLTDMIIKCYDGDTIDLTTGKIASNTGSGTTLSIFNSTIVVTQVPVE